MVNTKDRRGSETGGLLLAIDAGNTQTVFGVFSGTELRATFRIATELERTADELGVLLTVLLGSRELKLRDVRAVIVASVVPPLQECIERFGRAFLGLDPIFVGPGIRTGMAIRYDHPAEVGADRIVNAVAARNRFGAPVIVVDFGTATTFDVVNEAGEYAGGVIAPGLGISAEALFSRASRLYRVEIRPPNRVLGRSTVSAMQSGIFWGYVGLVDGILERLKTELGGQPSVVATGGLAERIAEQCRHIQVVEPQLTLEGLRLIYELGQE